MAYWVDNATMTTGAFSVANIDLQVNDTKSYTTWTLGGTGLMPGDTRAATLPVQNKGGVDFTYTATLNASGEAVLAPFITVTAYAGGNVASNKCNGGSAIAGASKTLTVGTAQAFISTPRTLTTSSTTETLCFEAQVSNAITKSASNKAVRVILQFTAVG
ncbi:hypothetical protein [Dietzia sp. B32]|uniref:hypothetical protein n=1 Tax=Dietzia sp. B32 TaxID=2915130 RepID=UPI0021ADF35E|nr:hypothetical protein [Dietzia sp. B32]UVE96630.1 hypothetical protein L8M95_07675 [Dietzia sp. B32]